MLHRVHNLNRYKNMTLNQYTLMLRRLRRKSSQLIIVIQDHALAA